MKPRPIKDRMREAKAKVVARRRVPRVFFLGPDDFSEFETTSPPTMKATFSQRGIPTEMTVLEFDGLAVRASQAKPMKGSGRYQSKLYCCHGTAVSVPFA